MGVPFLPARTLLGTDTFAQQRGEGHRLPVHRREARRAAGPVPGRGRDPRPRGRPLRQLPVHGTTVADLDLARAAKRLIITCERLVPDDEIRRDPTARDPVLLRGRRLRGALTAATRATCPTSTSRMLGKRKLDRNAKRMRQKTLDRARRFESCRLDADHLAVIGDAGLQNSLAP